MVGRTERTTSRWPRALLAGVVVLFLAVTAIALDRRFDRRFDWNNGLWGTAARNLHARGFAELRGGVYVHAGRVPRAEMPVYTGHPPGTAWALAGWMKAWGTSDAAVRSFAWAWSGAVVLLTGLLVARWRGPATGAVAAGVVALQPMALYFAGMANMEQPCLALMLAAGLAYAAWDRTGRRAWLGACAAFVGAAGWVDWPGIAFGAALALLAARRDRRDRRGALAVAAASAATGVLVLLYLVANDGSLARLGGKFAARSGLTRAPTALVPTTAPAAMRPAKPPDERPAWRRTASWAKLHATLAARLPLAPPAVALVIAGVIVLARERGSMTAAGRALGAVLATQVTFTLVFLPAARHHEYWQYYALAPLGAGAAVALGAAWQRGGVALGAAGTAALLCVPCAWAGYSARVLPLRDPPLPASALADARLLGCVGELRAHTRPEDVVLVARANVGSALGWYADRCVLAPSEEGKLAGRALDVGALVRRELGVFRPTVGRRLWLVVDEPQRAELTPAAEALLGPGARWGRLTAYQVDPALLR